MINLLRVFAFCVFAFVLAGQALAQPAAGTTWTNQRGSELTIISVDPKGRMEGAYINNAPGFGCQGTPYPAVGWVRGNSIGWSVIWTNAHEDCASVTSWGGVMRGSDKIETQWVLSHTGADGPRLLVGYDFFTKR